MTFLNIIAAFANMFLNTQKRKNFTCPPDVCIYIHARFYNNINVCTQSPGLIQKDKERCSAFEYKRQFYSPNRFQKAECKNSAL